MIIFEPIHKIIKKLQKRRLRCQFVKKSEFTFVNCDTFANQFHRYISLSRVEDMLENKKLVFVSPSLWDDPFETRYLNTIIKSSKDYRPRKMYCLCVRTSEDNEDASWQRYSNGHEPILRVKFNVKKLEDKLKDFAMEKNCHIYCAKIIYLNYDEIRDIEQNHVLQKKYLKGSDENKHVCLMSMKRKSFEYEKEYRLFIIPQENSNIDIENDTTLDVPIDISIFDGFTLNPMDRIREEDDKLVHKIHKAKYALTKEMIRDFLANIAPNAKFTHSVLYKNEKSVEAIKLKKHYEED